MHKDNRTELGSYQLRQTLLFAIISLVVGWGLGILVGILMVSTGIAALIYIIYAFRLALFIIWIIGLIGAINGDKNQCLSLVKEHKRCFLEFNSFKHSRP